MANEPVVTIIGNLANDPEARISNSGKPWVTFRLANTPRVRDRQTGDYTDGEALWLNCRAFGELAEHIVASLAKGMRVIVQGRMTQESYEKDGQKRVSINLEVDAIGPELRFATAQVTRGARSQGSQSAPGAANGQGQGQWAQPPVNAPQNGGQGAGAMNDYYAAPNSPIGSDEAPF